MNHTITTKQYQFASFEEYLLFLIEHNSLTSEQVKIIQDHVFLLSSNLVKMYNFQRSTTISRRRYKRIMESVYYTLDYAVLYTPNLSLEAEVDVFQLYEQGKEYIEEDHQLVYQKYQQLKQTRLPFNNERYQNIIDHQLLDFYINYDVEYHSAFCKEDLDYPLIDGLSMDHNMYNKKGVAMVLEYIHRFELEQNFCNQFASDTLKEIIHLYEELHGISITYLGTNLLEIILDQLLFSLLLNKEELHLFHEEEIELLYQRLDNNTEELVIQCFQQLSKFTNNPETLLYLQKYRVPFLTKLQPALLHHTLHSIVLHYQSKPFAFKIENPQELDSLQFQQLIESIQDAKSNKKIELILKQPLHINDLIEVLDLNLLFEKEVTKLFTSFDNVSIAVLFKTLYPEEFAFHREVQFTHHSLQLLAISTSWQQLFIDFIDSLATNRKEEIIQVLNHLDLNH